MNETELSQHVALVLQHSAGIIKKYDELYRLKGLKYNIFEIARISEKEVIICRVITDLLNPKGSHYKGDLYLKLFWDIVSPKMGGGIALNTEKAKVTAEYSTDAQRRIDIVIGDGNVFVPVEVKIRAGEQERQVGDYAKYSKVKNKGRTVPVLFLTPDGRPPETAQANEYVSVSFNKDIVSWLEQCLLQTETENTPPVCEVIKQFLSAIKSIFGKTENEKMNKEIAEGVMASEETMQAALEIKKWLDENTLNDENCGGLPAWELFKGVVFRIVKKQFPLAGIDENDRKWYDINVPIKNGTYTLYVNYNWQIIAILSERKKDARSAEAKKLAQKMTELTGVTEKNDGWAVWATAQARYPGMETVNEAIYPYLLYKKYEQNPEEAASHIIKMVTELEKT